MSSRDFNFYSKYTDEQLKRLLINRHFKKTEGGNKKHRIQKLLDDDKRKLHLGIPLDEVDFSLRGQLDDNTTGRDLRNEARNQKLSTQGLNKDLLERLTSQQSSDPEAIKEERHHEHLDDENDPEGYKREERIQTKYRRLVNESIKQSNEDIEHFCKARDEAQLRLDGAVKRKIQKENALWKERDAEVSDLKTRLWRKKSQHQSKQNSNKSSADKEISQKSQPLVNSANVKTNPSSSSQSQPSHYHGPAARKQEQLADRDAAYSNPSRLSTPIQPADSQHDIQSANRHGHANRGTLLSSPYGQRNGSSKVSHEKRKANDSLSKEVMGEPKKLYKETGAETYKCDDKLACSMTFASAEELRSHKRTVCHFCWQKFPPDNGSGLFQHLVQRCQKCHTYFETELFRFSHKC